jgi:hypothetical protein
MHQQRPVPVTRRSSFGRPASIKRELANVAVSEFITDGMAPYVCGQITE